MVNLMVKDVLKKPTGFYEKFERKPTGSQYTTHYCPGCGHGKIHKIIAEALEDLEIGDNTIFVSPVGCSVFAYYYINAGNIQSAHGRAAAVGTGLSRSNPDSIVISYQGDGDLAAIGTGETIHAANRGENMTVIFVNNAIYGMTGGQMAPTTMEGQITTTTPRGRDPDDQGYPIRMCEMIGTLEAPVFVERVSVTDSKGIRNARKAIRKALQSQKDGQGYSFVEVLSPCPVGWKMSSPDAVKWVKDVMEEYFPVENFKDLIKERPPKPKPKPLASSDEIIKVLGLTGEEKLFDADPEFLENFPEQRLRIAGFGGQGVLMAGTTLCMLGMNKDLSTCWLPSYGPAIRGGTANCHVVLSNSSIGSPVVDKPNVLIAMNLPSLDSFEDIVTPGGLIIVNSSIVERKVKRDDVESLYIPMTRIAEDQGLRRASNMVALTAYISYTKLMSIDELIILFEANFKKKELIRKNVEIIRATHQYIQNM